MVSWHGHPKHYLLWALAQIVYNLALNVLSWKYNNKNSVTGHLLLTLCVHNADGSLPAHTHTGTSHHLTDFYLTLKHHHITANIFSGRHFKTSKISKNKNFNNIYFQCIVSLYIYIYIYMCKPVVGHIQKNERISIAFCWINSKHIFVIKL